ncbi:MGH1-like glycoside hydrolase domain-containing protein [Lentzea flaviverrucosa]|nr:hypothetical protein [Lentzea flaviverrucosa]
MSPRTSRPSAWTTEEPNSPYYEPDGYWRGPVWAPATARAAAARWSLRIR